MPITITVSPEAFTEVKTFYVNLGNAGHGIIGRSSAMVTLMPPGAWVGSTLKDFQAGTLGTGAYVSETGNGEVTLAPTVGSEFSGSGAVVPDGWTIAVVDTGGTGTLANGSAVVDGFGAYTDATYTVGRTLEFVATFDGTADQAAGLAKTQPKLAPYAAFGVLSDGKLIARSVVSGNGTTTVIPGNWFGAPHRFRIDWTTTGIVYWIDGVQRASHTVNYGKNAVMRPAFADFTTGGPALSVNWMRMTPYAASAVYTSAVYDAGAVVGWQTASWVADVPTGTKVVVEVRTGTTATPDLTNWLPFRPVLPGELIGGASQYAQYRITLSTTVQNAAPAVKEVIVTYVK
jgi:hypothetical protein